MKAKYVLPIDSIRGCIGPDYYARVLNGQKIIQHRPRQSSEKQRIMRENFRKKYAKRIGMLRGCYGGATRTESEERSDRA